MYLVACLSPSALFPFIVRGDLVYPLSVSQRRGGVGKLLPVFLRKPYFVILRNKII